MATLAIKGHPTRGRDIIQLLEMLGGRNSNNCTGQYINRIYFINKYGYIESTDDIKLQLYCATYNLEEFEEKYPDKVGDRVCFPDDLSTPFTINKMWWDENANELLCSFIEDDIEVPVVGIRTYKEETLEVTEEFYNKHCVNCGSQRCTHNGEWLKECEHYKEETTNKAIFEGNAQSCDIMNNIIKENMKKIKIDIPEGYEFFGIDDDNKIVLTEKQPQYPKTYKECFNICFGNKHHIVQVLGLDGLGGNKDLFERFIKLKICRDAYWKIAGDWKPDVMYCDLYCIGYDGNVVTWKMQGGCRLLAFPTEEMRDTFYENFKDLIEQCKELL